ncbi:hypothetical protein [Ottowia oryzae]
MQANFMEAIDLPNDAMQFGHGSAFDPTKVRDFLSLRKEDVSRISNVSIKSVRYDHAIPEQVKDRLEEIANTINWVADAFDGDIDKTTTWFKVSNPLLGDISPKDMIRLGRYERLRNFIIHAMQERNAMNASRVAPNQA